MFPCFYDKNGGDVLVLNAHKDENTWDDEVQVSSKLLQWRYTNIFTAGEVMKVKDLFKSVAINSAMIYVCN